ncbi:MAG: bifunctional nicotinamidase/pyrazinamidase [Planctomycetaceae bacterium]|nr:bifunctional nicotinamidase/pyrazinamidase [Planctomycetaceae bacterium]
MNALIIEDLQNDFLPGGALAVPHGDKIIPIVNRLMDHFDLVIATKDWHPRGHVSFASAHEGKRPGDVIDADGVWQTLWPDHCVQHTSGAELADAFDVSRVDYVLYKGMDPKADSYSSFFDNGRRNSTGLADYLVDNLVREVFVCGLATEYSVRYTTIDACRMDFATYLVQDACRGIELRQGDIQQALEDMVAAGAVPIDASLVLQPLKT